VEQLRMARKQNDFHYIENHQFEDDKIHAAILADGDHEAAKKVSDQVARDIGLTEAEIEALSAPPQNVKGKPK
jgi:predicted dinucleotide-binding enzyme